MARDVICCTGSARAGSVLNRGTGLGAGAPAIHGVAGGAHYALKVAGLTAGAFHFGVVVAHNKQFKEVFTFQAFEFEYRHMELLKYFIIELFWYCFYDNITRIVKKRELRIFKQFTCMRPCGFSNRNSAEHSGDLLHPLGPFQGGDDGPGSLFVYAFGNLKMVLPEPGDLGEMGYAYDLVIL